VQSKNLLILGAGRHQVPLIVAAEAAGFRTILADNKAGSPGRAYCSLSSMISATDLDACRALALKHDVCGILVAGTDQPVRVMAALSAELDLPCYITPDGAVRATNKLLQRRAMKEAGLRQPRFITLAANEDWEWDIYPAVVKPADSQGQRGVVKVHGPDEMRRTMEDSAVHSSKGELVVEEFVPGQEFTASAWVQEGQIVFIALSDRATYSAHSLGVCFQHLYPSIAAAGMEEEVERMLVEIAGCFGMSHGPLYVQLIASKDGPVLVEAAARIGGGHESTLFPRVSTFDPVQCLLGWLQGRDYTGDKSIRYGEHAITNFVFAHAGVVGSCCGMEGLTRNGIEEGGFYVEQGDCPTGMLDGQGRVGYFIARGSSRREVEASAERFYRQLSVTDASTGANLVFLPGEAEILRPKLA